MSKIKCPHCGNRSNGLNVCASDEKLFGMPVNSKFCKICHHEVSLAALPVILQVINSLFVLAFLAALVAGYKEQLESHMALIYTALFIYLALVILLKKYKKGTRLYDPASDTCTKLDNN